MTWLHRHDDSWEVSELVGPYTWGAIHYLAEAFPCPPCAQHGGALMRGVHDVVNYNTGKAIMFPQDLYALAMESAEAAMSLEAQEFPRCTDTERQKFERCILDIKARPEEEQPESAYAVCTASVGCSPRRLEACGGAP